MTTLEIVFTACLFGGAGYALLTLLIGGVSHGVGHLGGHSDAAQLHHDTGHALDTHHIGLPDGHHVGDGHLHPVPDVSAQPDLGHHPGAHDIGHHPGDHDAALHHPSLASGLLSTLLGFFSPMMLSAFLVGFGSFGVFASLALHLPAPVSIAAAVAGGFAFRWFVIMLLSRVFGSADRSSHIQQGEFVGINAEVITSIPVKGVGIISIESFGNRQSLPARLEAAADTDAVEQEPVPRGARVRIRRIESGTALVIRIDA